MTSAFSKTAIAIGTAVQYLSSVPLPRSSCVRVRAVCIQSWEVLSASRRRRRRQVREADGKIGREADGSVDVGMRALVQQGLSMCAVPPGFLGLRGTHLYRSRPVPARPAPTRADTGGAC